MFDAVCAGHVCLDLIPAIDSETPLEPGRLVETGEMTFAPGGSVANTGLVLNRLGTNVALCGRVGDDPFARLLLDVLERERAGLGGSMAVVPGENTSYTVVLTRPDQDRIFLHCPGANRSFIASDVPDGLLDNARLIHFGYPPLMQSVYRNDGREMRTLFERAKSRGLTTSLDMSLPDPGTESGRIDWVRFLGNVLPFTDIFAPSTNELAFMLGMTGHGRAFEDRLAGQALDMGARLVLLKRGDLGLGIWSSPSSKITGRAAPAAGSDWLGLRIFQACYQADVVGTTGAGDATIGGFLAAFLQGKSPEDCVNIALGAGAACCEAADSISGVPDWATLVKRITRPWQKASSDEAQ